MAKEKTIVEESMEENHQEIDDDISKNIVIEKKETQLSDLPGVGPATVEKLAAAGFGDLISIAVASLSKVVEATGMSEPAARKLIQSARTSIDMGFESGVDLLKRRERVLKIQIPAKAINELLGGGFETGAIVEV